MLKNKKEEHIYFLYSDEQVKEKNKILDKIGKEFVPGIVVVNGARKKFSQISKDPKSARYIDTVVVAEGIIGNMTYTETTTRKKG